MKTNNILTLSIVVFVSLITFSCKETATKENPMEEKTQSQANADNREAMPVMDPSLWIL